MKTKTSCRKQLFKTDVWFSWFRVCWWVVIVIWKRKKKQAFNYGSCRIGLVWSSLTKTWLMVCLGLLNYLCWPCTSHVGLSSQDQEESQCPLTMSKQRDHLRSASHVTRLRRSLWREQRHNGLLYFPNPTTPLLLQVDTLARIAAITPDFWCVDPWRRTCVWMFVCIWLVCRELMRQVCGSHPSPQPD